LWLLKTLHINWRERPLSAGRQRLLNEETVIGERKVEHIPDFDIPGLEDAVTFPRVQFP
jgi:hypothetical protein